MDFCKYCMLSIGASPETSYLTCIKCNSITHLKCVVDKPSLLCDVFYNFTCEKCSETKRMSLTRQHLTWNCVLILTLYNLKHNLKVPSDRQGYYHWKTHIVSFIDKYWTVFFGTKKKPRVWQTRIPAALFQSPALFKSGNEALGENGWWQLVSTYWPQKIFEDYKTKKTSKEELSAYGAQVKTNTESSNDCSSLLNSDVYDDSYVRNNFETDLNIECLRLMCVFITVGSNWDMLLNEPLTNTYDSSSSVPNLSDSSSNTPVNLQDKISSGDEGDKSEEESDCDKLQKGGKRRRKSSSSHKLWPWETKRNEEQGSSVPMSEYEELVLLKKLAHVIHETDSKKIPCYVRRYYRKLVVRKAKRERNLPLFSIIRQETKKTNYHPRILDRYKSLLGSQQLEQNSFLVDKEIKNETSWKTSPYTQRVLKPYIRVDYDTLPPWLRLMNSIISHKGESICRHHPITYSYVEARHIPSVNMLCSLYFWPGVDLTECLQYPDFSCIVEYNRLVIGFAFMVPDISHTEAYISFIFTRPEWRRAGIATFMLYHLIHTCMGKDVTLHVSATNPALMLYQKFGFKVEEFIQDFYDKYLPHNSKECRHALFLRLSR